MRLPRPRNVIISVLLGGIAFISLFAYGVSKPEMHKLTVIVYKPDFFPQPTVNVYALSRWKAAFVDSENIDVGRLRLVNSSRVSGQNITFDLPEGFYLLVAPGTTREVPLNSDSIEVISVNI